jgi:predicted peptidase
MPLSTATFEKPITRTVRLDYLISLPAGYNEESGRWPLILFLHGAGERGDDINRVRVHGIPRVVDRGDDLPFITVSPQCPPGTLWAAQLDALDALLHEIAATCAVDQTRIYLTGLSMGGNGTWHLAAAYPRRFAAIAPVCGWGDFFAGFPDRVSMLKDVPTWAFHGARDTVVPLSGSQVLVDRLQESGGDVRLTVYPEAGHDSWTETYDNPELYAWFLRHHL